MNINERLIIVLGKLSFVYKDKLVKNLEELGLPASMFPILAHLNKVESCQINELSSVGFITSGTVTYIVGKLEKKGYVVKYKSETDKRSNFVKITDLGYEKYNQVYIEHMKYVDTLMEDFSNEEKEVFINLIKHFGKTIENKGE